LQAFVHDSLTARVVSGQVQTGSAPRFEEPLVIVLGIILLVIGFIAKIAILWTIGIILVVIGAILAILGLAGREVGGRRHWF
jgi:protein-S-isoprenylcysteine O-methyltransferase Ste14